MKYLFAIFLFLLVTLLLPSSSYAVLCNGLENKLNLCYPGFGGFDLSLGIDLTELVGWLYSAIVVLSGLAAFIMFLWGGFQYLTSTGNPAQISDAKDRIQKAGLGLILILGSFLIIQFINPELTAVTSPLLRALSHDAPDQPGSTPPGQTAHGIYFCEGDNCSGKFIRADHTSCTDLAAQRGALGVDNMKSIGDSDCALLPTTPPTSLTDWNDKTDSIRMNNVFDPRRNPYALFIFEHKDSGGRAMCFRTGDTSDNLDRHQIRTNVLSDTGWAGDISSWILSEKGQITCAAPGITLVDKFDTAITAPPIVFLFNVTNYGARSGSNPRKFALPLERWKPGDKDQDGKRNDDYRENRNLDIRSLWIPDTPVCSLGPGQTPEPCAVRFWDKGDWKPNVTANICFRQSEPDLSLYSFEYNPDDKSSRRREDPNDPDGFIDTGIPRNCASATNDLTDDIRGLEVIPASQCPVPGVVRNCNG